MIKRHFIIIVSVFLAIGISIESEAQKQILPESFIKEYLSKLTKGDYDAFFAYDIEYRLRAANIKKETPRTLWEEKLFPLKTEWQKKLADRSANFPGSDAIYYWSVLFGRPDIHAMNTIVMEVRPAGFITIDCTGGFPVGYYFRVPAWDVFVKAEYPLQDLAPTFLQLEGSKFERRSIKSLVLKITIVKIEPKYESIMGGKGVEEFGLTGFGVWTSGRSCFRGGEAKIIELQIYSATETEKLLKKEHSQFEDPKLDKLKAFITDQWKQVIQIPKPKQDWRELATLKITGKYDDYSSLYLLGVNRRNLASNALVAANTFLTKKNDLKNAQKYADLAARHYIESNDLFKASEQVFSGSVSMTAQVLEATYRGSKEASKYGWYLMCGPKCYEVADYMFLMTDFAMDYGLEGMDEAKKNLITTGFVKTLLKTGGVSHWIENRTTHLIGDSGLYGVMDKTINSPEFQKAFMKVVAESGAYATKEIAETGVKTVINNSINFIKGSSNLKPGN